MDGLYQKLLKDNMIKLIVDILMFFSEIINFLLKVNPIDRPIKHPLLMKRIEFFKSHEGFKDDDFDEMDEGKLLKTLRITKNMLFLSEQLPNPNYDRQKTT